MSWILKEREIEALLSSDGTRRYQYFVRRVCDNQSLWGLFHEGWASLGDDEGRPALALWPHPLYAEKLATEDWRSYRAQKILLREFLEQWVPRLDQEQVMLAVFPVPLGEVVSVTAKALEASLREASPDYTEES